MTTLTTEFTTRGILSDYTTFIVPASKKKLAVNRAEVKDDKVKGSKEMHSEYKKTKKSNTFDEKIKKLR